MLALIAAVVLTQIPALAPENPWQCEGLKNKEWGPGYTLVPLGFSKNGKFAIAQREQYGDLGQQTFYDRKYQLVDLRTDKVLKEEYDGATIAKGLASALKAQGIVESCPQLDSPPREIVLKGVSAGGAIEVWLKTPEGKKRVTVLKQPSDKTVSLVGSLTSPHEARTAIVFLELDFRAADKGRVRKWWAFGASLKDGFFDIAPPDLAPVKPILEGAGVRTGDAELWPLGFSPEGHFSYLVRAPDSTRFVVEDLVTNTRVEQDHLVGISAAQSGYEIATASTQLMPALTDRRVLVQAVKNLTPEGFPEHGVIIEGSKIWLERKKPVGRKLAAEMWEKELALVAIYQSPFEPRAALIFSYAPDPPKAGRGTAARDIRIVGVQLTTGFKP